MEFSTLNGYKVKDKKAVRYYETVEVMKNDSTLKHNMYVKTKGYYTANDGGSSEYHITNTQSDSYYQEELDNGLYATLLIKNGIYTPEQFGAKNDGSEDCSDIFNFIFSKMSNNNKLLLSGTYLIDEPLYLPNKNNIVISGGTLKASENLEGYILNSNQTAVTNYAGWNFKTENLTLENLFIDGSYTANGIYLDAYLRVKIISCTIHNFKDYGIYLNNGHEGQLIGTNIIGRTNGDEALENTGLLINAFDNIIDSCVIAYCQWAIDVKGKCNQICNSHFYCNLQNGGNVRINKTSYITLTNNYFDGSGIEAINPWYLNIDDNIFLLSDNTHHILKFTKDSVANLNVRGIFFTNNNISDNRTDTTTPYDLISCDFIPVLTENCYIDNLGAPDTIKVNNPYNLFTFKTNSIPVIIPDSFFRANNSNNTIGEHFTTNDYYDFSFNGNYIKSTYVGNTSYYPWLFFKIYVPERMKISKEVLDGTTFDMAIFDSNETYVGGNKATVEKGFYYVGVYRTHEFLISNN